ncbi:zinc finger protein 830 [Tribolium castaneum]|uniref:Zinc finger protein 830 n=1 Tax=Tribolium castaneum TaxID=7070 RepID=D6W8Z6_TRICA|nr:Zinc finger protein 830-like Protein [Tribolium castaneum]
MSATFKNSKKKLVQTEFRRLISEKSKLQKDVKKIESPLFKYNDSGQLTCVLCKSVVKSEAVWTVHINSKQHRENVELAKKLKEKTNNFTTPLKRPLTPPMEVPQKKIKGILKNSNSSKSEEKEIPDDFFDAKSQNGAPILPVKKPREEKMEVDDNTETIPEGFFDDPKLDAKARNQEYKDPVEEEWEKFQKEIREADSKSAAIIAEDQEEATNERQIDEIEEQMKKLSRVLDLEKKKETIITHTSGDKVDQEDDSNEDDNEDFDEYLDWRCKKAFK